MADDVKVQEAQTMADEVKLTQAGQGRWQSPGAAMAAGMTTPAKRAILSSVATHKHNY
jgi:hypothetical protein